MGAPQILITSGDDCLARERCAQLIKDLRGRATQREFAKQLGTSYTAVQDWEKQIRLPSQKNLQRIAELKGWTYEELVRYLFCSEPHWVTDPIDPIDPLQRIMAQVRELSQGQVEQLMDYLTAQMAAGWTSGERIMRSCLTTQQKHNLHLLLRASLKGQSPMEKMTQHGIDPPLFTDIFLRDDTNRVVTYDDLEQLSSLCYQIVQWHGDRPPTVDASQTYAGQAEQLLNHLTRENKAEID